MPRSTNEMQAPHGQLGPPEQCEPAPSITRPLHSWYDYRREVRVCGFCTEPLLPQNSKFSLQVDYDCGCSYRRKFVALTIQLEKLRGLARHNEQLFEAQRDLERCGEWVEEARVRAESFKDGAL